MAGVFYLLSQALAGFALALALPALIGFATGEAGSARAFLFTGLLLGFLAAAVIFGLRDRVRDIGRVGSYVLVVGAWTIPVLIGAVPLSQTTGSDYVTALFEVASGLTTTGATAIGQLDRVGRAVIFYRAELQWLGGLLTLATIAAILAATGLGGLSASQVALVTGAETRSGRLLSTARQILVAYATVTVACMVLLIASGIPPFDAVCIALATVSTGGFMPIDGTFAAYANPFANAVVAVFMLIGATSIVWHRMVVQGRWALLREHRESYWLIAMALLAAFLYDLALRGAASGESGWGRWLLDGLLTGTSLVTTTGFESRPGALAALPATLVLLLALVGGSGISTAGGIKYYRIGILFGLASQELRKLVYPHSVRESRFASIRYEPEMIKAVLSYLFVSLVLLAAATLLVSAAMPDLEASLTVVIAAFSNIGPLYPSGWAPDWPAYAAMDSLAKLVLVATMILGRLEILVVLAAFSLSYWRS